MTTQPLARYGAPNGALASGLTTSVTPRPGTQPSYTVEAVRRHLGDVRFTLVEVPDTQPRTKPKALDFALPLCRGEYVVVFDAEDRPEPDQLLKSVSQFRATPDISCLQARLVIANGRRSPLSALFAGEYAALFAVTLPALARWGFLVPLGGTSNHFRIRTLRELGGWDAFNVTEDADLGVRLTRRGLKTMVSQSWTLEDAPDRLGPWLGQRTRWMKGWMQTYLVHMRRPLRLLQDIGWQGFVTFQVIVLGMILAPLLHAGFFVYLGAMSLTDTPIWSSADHWTMICLLVLGLGHGAAIANNILGLHRTRQRDLMGRQVALPLYWLLIAWATIKALVELLRRPFHWFKTPHYAAVRTPRGTIEVAPVREAGP